MENILNSIYSTGSQFRMSTHYGISVLLATRENIQRIER